MSALGASLDEARDHLRVIRQTMERSTQYSTLSGWSGILVGIVAIVGVAITRSILGGHVVSVPTVRAEAPRLAVVWATALVMAIAIDFICNKRRAARVGKRVVSKLGAHIILAALPAFLAGAVFTFFFYAHNLVPYILGVWMLCYGMAICAVGLFSVRNVTYLGGAFVISGAITLLAPLTIHLDMMVLTFGGFHIIYGIVMARRHGW